MEEAGKMNDSFQKRILDRAVLGFFILLAGSLLFSNVFRLLIDRPLGNLLSNAGHANYTKGVGTAVGSLLWLLLFRLMFRKEGYDGQLRFRRFFKGLWLLLPAVLACCFMNIGDAVMNGISDFTVAFLSALAPGFGEEIALRGPALSNIMRKADDEKRLLLAWWLPAVTFGLMHATNLLVGANVTATLLQVVYATGIGLVYGAVVLRTGTLWPSVVAHFLTDFCALLGKTLYESKGILNREVGTVELIITLGSGVLYILFGIFLMRKSKRPEALAVWARKWNGNGISTL